MLSLVLMKIHSVGRNKSTYFYFHHDTQPFWASKWNVVFNIFSVDVLINILFSAICSDIMGGTHEFDFNCP